MDSSISPNIANTLGNPNTLGNQTLPPDTNPPMHVVPVLPTAGPNPSGPGDVIVDSTTAPVKRRPGRPKGSGKKYLDLGPSAPKIKRPVGRPRKDGLPAGSISTGRSARPRKSEPGKTSNNGQALPFPAPYFHFPGSQSHWQTGFPQLPGFPSGSGAPISLSHQGPSVPVPFQIDPNLDRNDWSDLLRTKPNEFLTILLASLSAPNPVSSTGPSVEEAFKSHTVSLAPNPVQLKIQPIPSLYSILKTFWLPVSPPYFSLTASASTSRIPTEYRFFYWDPQPLVFNGISCPSCATPLINRGRIRSGPVKIYDLENPFFIIGCEYVCKSAVCIASTSSEGRKYASTDTSILKSLPTKLKDEFPAHLNQGENDAGSGADVWNWQAMGVSRSLWNLVRGCLKCGLGREAIVQLVRAIQYGIPDEGEMKEEEEEEEPEDEGMQDINRGSDGGEIDTTSNKNQDDSIEAHQNTWKANVVLTPSHAESGASTSGIHNEADPAAPAPVAPPDQPAAPPQQYPFPQGGPYTPHPFASYSFFQQGAVFTPNAPGPELHPPSNQNANGDTTASPQAQTLKRPFAFPTLIDNNPESMSEPAQKRTRHCCKCGSQDCKGKGGRSFCMNSCQDCGKLECKGRNSRRPDKRCAEAWS